MVDANWTWVQNKPGFGVAAVMTPNLASNIADADSAKLGVVNSIRDSITPDVMFLCHVDVLPNEECVNLFGGSPKSGSIVRLAIDEGRRMPYCLARKGPVPEGVFVREGPSTAPADSGRILEMIME